MVINESLTRRLIPLGVIGSTTVFGAVSPGSNPDGGTQMDRTDLNGLLARVWRNLVNAVDLKSTTLKSLRVRLPLPAQCDSKRHRPTTTSTGEIVLLGIYWNEPCLKVEGLH